MTPYVLKGEKVDGRFFGTVSYGADVVGDTKGTDGFKSEKDLDSWARKVASDHKTSISPRETHKVERSFTL